MQVGIDPAAAGRRQFKDGTLFVDAVLVRCAVKITGRIQRQVVGRSGQAAKAIQQRERPASAGGRQFENCAAKVLAVMLRAAIKIARAVEDQAAGRRPAVSSVGEGVEELLSPTGSECVNSNTVPQL